MSFDRRSFSVFAASLAVVFVSWSSPVSAGGSPTVAAAPSGTLFPLASVGYSEAEFFVEGTASSYHNAAGPPFAADGIWTVEADAAPTPAYKTRLQVYRPIDPDTFSGVVL